MATQRPLCTPTLWTSYLYSLAFHGMDSSARLFPEIAKHLASCRLHDEELKAYTAD